MSRKLALFGGAAIIALGISVSQFGILQQSHAETTEQTAAAQKPQAMPVQTIAIQAKPTRLWVDFSARLSAVDQVEIHPQVSGTILERKFEDGQRVTAGDVLFVIDPRPYQAAVDQAKADLAIARDKLIYARREFTRAQKLVKTSAVSKSNLDERENAVAVARGEVAAAKARLDTAAINLDYAYVKAPISGRVSRAEVTVGNLVSATAPPLLTTIVAEDKIYADFEVDERTYLDFIRTKVRTQQDERQIPVRLQLGAEKPLEFKGYIWAFDNRIDPSSGTIRARALFDNKDGYLLPGMFARVKLGSATEENEILISEKVILTDQDRKFVYVVGEDNTAQYRQVQLGRSNEGQRIVKSGLQDGDMVIASRLLMMRPNTPVMPVTADQATHKDHAAR
jgi:multidrug efflux system membrane fusion protein